MYASRIFHSFGTVQSNTGVPEAHLAGVQWNLLAEETQRFADARAGEAAADREQPPDTFVELGAKR